MKWIKTSFVILVLLLCAKALSQQKNILKIYFNNDIILCWDSTHQQFVADKKYKNLLNNPIKINTLARNIQDNEDLGIRLCTKSLNLKKGDIAFLFLYQNGKIPPHSCLNRQFDVLDECNIPYGLMDFVEQNRTQVSEKVLKCLAKTNIDE